MRLYAAATAMTVAMAMACPALAQSSPQDIQNQRAISDAQLAYRQAARTHNQDEMRRTRQRLQAAYHEAWIDRQAEAEAAQPPPPGVPREVYQRLVQARDANRDALASGDPARMQRAHADLRQAYAELGRSQRPRASR